MFKLLHQLRLCAYLIDSCSSSIDAHNLFALRQRHAPVVLGTVRKKCAGIAEQQKLLGSGDGGKKLGRVVEAIDHFDNSIQLDSSFAFVTNLIGLLKKEVFRPHVADTSVNAHGGYMRGDRVYAQFDMVSGTSKPYYKVMKRARPQVVVPVLSL